MGLQLNCPLCGMSRSPDQFEARALTAKQVTSKGGNRGFEHTPVPVPDDLQRRIEREVEQLHQRFAVVEEIGEEIGAVVEEEIGAVVEEEIGEEIERAIRERTANDRERSRTEIEREIKRAVDSGLVEDRIDVAVERALDG